ncbi:MAG: phage portal protein [Chthoniobacteraceae bacterium]|nr:phage portal protein [Chthoniobacteraceae bacterium]
MPTSSPTRRPLLYGPNNKPLSLGLYPSLRNKPGQYRPRRKLSRDTREQITACDRTELLELSRQLFAQLGNLGTAIRDKNAWAFGDAWDPHYTGTNTAWGKAATTFLTKQFFPNCDRHGRYNSKTLLKLSGMAWDRDGDDLMLLTEDDSGSGFPKVEIIPATRIGNGDSNDNLVKGGRFDGDEIYDGVIFNAAGKPIGVRVLGRLTNPDSRLQTQEYQDFSLGYGGTADLAYQPEWCDQVRGIPLIGRVVLDWLDLQDIDVFLKRGIKRAASVGLISKTAEGEAGHGNEIMTEEEVTDADGTTRTVTLEEIEGGEMYYLNKDGEELEGLKFESPHPNVENFIKRIERRGLAAVGWFYELLYLGESGRAASRQVCDCANTSIWQQQEIGWRRTTTAVRYALAKGMKNGFIPRNPDSMDAYTAWEFGLPKQLSVDAGNDEAADREALKMGITSKAHIAQKKGFYWQDIRKQRTEELVALIADAETIVAASAGKITFDRAMELCEQRTANGALASNPGQKPASAPAKP